MGTKPLSSKIPVAKPALHEMLRKSKGGPGGADDFLDT